MNWIDFFVLFVLLLAMLNGYRRGLFREISTSIGLIIGIIFAVSQADWLAALLEGKFNISPGVLYVFSFMIMFGVLFGLLRLLGFLFYKLVKLNQPKPSDKMGGSLFGILKGAIVLSLLFLLFLFPTPLKSFDDAIESSKMARPIRAIVPVIYDNTGFFHPESDSFLGEVQRGILLSSAPLYAQNPEGALNDNSRLGMSYEDVETLKKLNKYFGKPKKNIKQ